MVYVPQNNTKIWINFFILLLKLFVEHIPFVNVALLHQLMSHIPFDIA